MSIDHHDESSQTDSQWSRRHFLTTTAATAGAGIVLGSLATGAEAKSASSASSLVSAPKAKPRTALAAGETIRMGVIGTGGMGTGHCDAFMSLNRDGKENVKVVALADVCQPRLNSAKEKCESGQQMKVDAYTDYRKLLERDDIHGVLIASPEHWHSKHGIDSIVAGKDVYLEKPMTLNLDMALELHRVVKANPDMILQVGTQMMRLPKYGVAKKMIADGMIGKACWSQTSYCRNSMDGEWLYYAIDPAWEPGKNLDWDGWCGPLGKMKWDPALYARWRRYRKTSTGIIGDLLVHVMTPLCYALDMGWPTRVVACGGHYVDTAMENHDQINLTVNFEKGHTLVVAGSTCNENGLEIIVRGHKGTIYLGGTSPRFAPERIFVEKENLEEQTIQCEDIGNDQDQHRLGWLKCIRTREQPEGNVDMGAKIMVIVDLATRSLWEGGAFAFDPQAMKARKV